MRELLGDEAMAAITGFGAVEDFTAYSEVPTIVVTGGGMSLAEQEKLERPLDTNNRTAIVTKLHVPKTVSESPTIMPEAASQFEIRKSSVLTLARVRERSRNASCVSLAELNETKEQLETHRAYFMGIDYKPFSSLDEHKEALLLLCRGGGAREELTSAQLGPVLLRALHAHDPELFPADNARIRATLLHQIGEGAARRYYLFGHSILTHFQRGTLAGTLQSGSDDDEEEGIVPLCSVVPGLQIVEKDSKMNVCERNPQGGFVVRADEPVDGTLYHLILPTTLPEQLACTPTTITTEGRTSLAKAPRGCSTADVLPDPYALLDQLRPRTYVFRAALDVAYTFRREE